jgi:uncharacterized protein (TIGR00369 family)
VSDDTPPPAGDAETMDLETLEDLIRVPNFHDWLNLEVASVGAGEASIVLPYREELIGNPQIPAIHGGILAGLIDLAGGAATFTVCNAPTPTVDLRIDYVRPALEKHTVAEAEIVNAGSTIAFVDVDVRQADGDETLDDYASTGRGEWGKLVATGRATYSTKNAKPKAGPEDFPIG